MSETGKITLTIHGLRAFHGEVDAEVFAHKFAAFMRGLGVSDKEANGTRALKFILTDLRKNTATAELVERKIKTTPDPTRSGIDYFVESIKEIRDDSPRARNLPRKLVEAIVSLNGGVSETFEFGELKITDRPPLLLDAFLEERAKKVLADIKSDDRNGALFEGAAFGSFDGTLKAVDYQQDTKTGTIRLAAGGVAIDCNITCVSVDEVRGALDRRARFFGKALYERDSPLPKMLDVSRIEIVNPGEALSVWKGAFNIPVSSWGDE